MVHMYLPFAPTYILYIQHANLCLTSIFFRDADILIWPCMAVISCFLAS